MDKQMFYNFNLQPLCSKGCKLSKAAFLGKSYTVLPVSMIVAGAYFPGGSEDEEIQALFFDGKDLEKSKNTWNGRPASLGHPKNGITMNEPESFNEHWLGFVFNTQYDSKAERLVAELWLDDVRGDQIIDKVNRGEEIDVSIGAFGTVSPYRGKSNGVEYFYKYSDIRGDHLAVLPESEGACSWQDGCGIRAEKEVLDNKPGDKSLKGVDMAKKCDAVEVVEEKVKSVSCEDILKNPDGYDKSIVDAINMRNEARKKHIESLASVSFEGGPLCNKFLEDTSMADLDRLNALVRSYEQKLEEAKKVKEEKKVVAAEKSNNVDFSISAQASKEEPFKLEPAVIEW